ncbi:MAG: class I SAM-dependent methyltransferase [Gammaproteobacteria bacterium]|nr:MAG: class I SAM-dependent methyltransferase [Gammaproteobacteria bacterium]
MNPGTRKWNARYRDATPAPPARVLVENIHLLPAHGAALDLACGLGSHAFLLASHGLETWAWDSSCVAIEHVRARAKALGLPVHAELRDVVVRPPPPDRFDVVVVVRFLDRSLSHYLIDALRSGGVLFYQTFTQTHVGDSGPGNPEYRLRDNELLSMFPGLRVLVYREEGRIGPLDSGFRDQAMLVAAKL